MNNRIGIYHKGMTPIPINLVKSEFLSTAVKSEFLSTPIKKEVSSKITYDNSKGESEERKGSTDPKVWGPLFWFTLHNGSVNYPDLASNIAIERMKGFINGIPYMLPCKDCSNHARTFIEKSDLDAVCCGKEKLFNFFVDFHNYVNKRYGKKIYSYEEAKRLY